MTLIIDRRSNPKGKNHGNRQRFVRRIRDQVKDAVKNSIRDKNIKDLTTGENIRVPVKNISEPTFGHDKSKGIKDYVHPGNEEFIEGDLIAKPSSEGDGQGSGQGSGDGESKDEFVFSLTKDEFLDIFFEDLELPNLIKQKLTEITTLKLKRAGYTNTGNPSNIDIKQTTKLALARRIALKRPNTELMTNLQGDLEAARKWQLEMQVHNDEDIEKNLQLIEETELNLFEANRRLKAVPWIDPVDVRYRNFTPQPKPITQAVVFFIMDVSGSMMEEDKSLAKKFFVLLNMFLQTKYEKVDIIFIRHTENAQEVDEHTFFYDPSTGGTVVSSAFIEMNKIIKERYPLDSWNIYCAQASDGDNSSRDSAKVVELLEKHILPVVQYMAYIEINRNSYQGILSFNSSDKDLWKSYLTIKNDNFEMRKVSNASEIYPVFRELFARENI